MLHAVDASPDEAAAVIAAVERFLRDHAPPLAAAKPQSDPWQRAAILEGARREPDERDPWGDPVSWG
jgi:hypothetical protein